MHLTTVTVSDKGQISIPKHLRRELNIRRGEKLVMIEESGRIILEKEEKIAKKLALLERQESLATMLASQKALRTTT